MSMNHKRITSNHARPRLAYALAAWAAIMAGAFALAAGQTGCMTIEGLGHDVSSMAGATRNAMSQDKQDK
jgi:predicted small secreted protein